MSWGAWSFANPWVLLWLAALPGLAILHSARGSAPAIVFSSLEPFRALSRARRARTGGFLAGLMLVAMACFIIALARPRRETESSRSQVSGIDIMLTLDISPSMEERDFTIGGFPASRLEAVQHVTERFIRGRPRDRIGIVAFAGQPALISPLTLDHDWLLENLAQLRVGLVRDSTAIGTAIASAASRLKDRTDSKSRILLLLTDGDNNAGNIAPNTAAEAARTLGIKIYTVCAGSLDEAEVLARRGINAPRQPGQIDEEALKKIAEIGGGEFYRATDSKSLERIFEEIDRLERSRVETTRTKEYHEWFRRFVLAGLASLGASMVLAETVWRRVP